MIQLVGDSPISGRSPPDDRANSSVPAVSESPCRRSHDTRVRLRKLELNPRFSQLTLLLTFQLLKSKSSDTFRQLATEETHHESARHRPDCSRSIDRNCHRATVGSRDANESESGGSTESFS